MYKNVSSDKQTVTKQEYDTVLKERDEYRKIALELKEYIQDIRGDAV